MPTPALLDVQRAFARALLREDDAAVTPHIVAAAFSAEELLCIHRNTCRSTLVAALRLSYRAVERLVGADFFDVVAERYVAAHPARSGYLNDYGGEFAAFLAGLDAGRWLPYLPDVARFEWALSVAANAPDAAVLTPTALLRFDAEDHPALRFERHPSVGCLALSYPADEIADAVLSGDDAAMAEVDLAAGPVHLVVHRGPDGIESERLTPPAHEFAARLFAGERLARVLEAAPEDAPHLLAQHLGKGRLSGVRIGR